MGKILNKSHKHTQIYLDGLQAQSKERHWSSNFAFLSAHNGLRKGKLHVLQGTAHSGKSTLIRSLIIDALDNNPDKTIFVFLSEESEDEFLTELNAGARLHISLLERVHVLSAVDKKIKSQAQLAKEITDKQPDLFIFDNLTTSVMYNDKKTQEQAEYVGKLKELANQTNIPIFLVVHTNADTTEHQTRRISMNDVRGSKTIVNLAEFYYISQQIAIPEKQRYSGKEILRIHQIINISKHRGQSTDEKLFYLNYDFKRKIYINDKFLPYSSYDELLKAKKGY